MAWFREGIRAMPSFRASELLPTGFCAVGALSQGNSAVLTIRAMSANSWCPSCGAVSDRVHSRYPRRLADLAQTPADPRPRPRPTRNGAAGRNRPARPARPSGRALAIARPDQPRNIQRTHPPPRLVTELFHKRRQPPRKLVPPIRHAPRSQIRARISPGAVNKLLFCQSSASPVSPSPAGPLFRQASTRCKAAVCESRSPKISLASSTPRN